MPRPLAITIDIISDTICPWCFVGKRRMERAMKEFTNVDFTVRWHPFYLGPPDGPIEGKLDRYNQKFGPARVSQMIPHMRQVGESEGIQFDYGGPIGPTFLSHRVLEYVKADPKKLDATVEALFRAYFEHRGNIFTVPTLLDILKAARIELDVDDLAAFLKAPDAREAVDREVMTAQAKGVSGVPDFVIDGKINLNGAQDTSEFVRIFSKLVRDRSEDAQL